MRTNLTHGVDPTTPNTWKATALAQASFPQVREGGRKMDLLNLSQNGRIILDHYHLV